MRICAAIAILAKAVMIASRTKLGPAGLFTNFVRGQRGVTPKSLQKLGEIKSATYGPGSYKK